jgi:hypothetical protein
VLAGGQGSFPKLQLLDGTLQEPLASKLVMSR